MRSSPVTSASREIPSGPTIRIARATVSVGEIILCVPDLNAFFVKCLHCIFA